MTCPQGKKSCKWVEAIDTGSNRFIHVRLKHSECRLCLARALCTRSATQARALGFRPTEDEVLQKVRQQQQTKQWQAVQSTSRN